MGRNLVAVAIVWILSLVGVAVWAQGKPTSSAPTQDRAGQPGKGLDWNIFSGDNIGFKRVLTPDDRPGKVTGTFVVKVDGKWMEVMPLFEIVR
jgi:hypothetical protein